MHTLRGEGAYPVRKSDPIFPSIPIASDEELIQNHQPGLLLAGEVCEAVVSYTVLDPRTLKAQERVALQIVARIRNAKVSYVAAELRCCYNTAEKLLACLVKAGFLIKKSGKKMGVPNTYIVVGGVPKIWGGGSPRFADIRGAIQDTSYLEIQDKTASFHQEEPMRRAGPSELADASFEESEAPIPQVKASKPRQTGGAHGDLVGYFRARHEAEHGHRLDVAWKRDCIIAASLLNTFDEAELHRRIDAFMADRDPWRTKNGFTIPAFKQNVNAYAQRLSSSDRTVKAALMDATPEYRAKWIAENPEHAKILGVQS